MMADRQRQRRFETLLRDHQRIVFKVAAAYASGVSDRDDLAQEIAAQLWRSFGRFDERRAKFSTWMYRVALNVAISHVRRAHRAGNGHADPLAEPHFESVPATDGSLTDDLEHAERLAALHAFIGGLDPLNRALVLLYLEERSHAEIAEVLGISATNVATKLNRIKQKLRAQAVAAATEEVEYGTR